jgi:(1->4)-alpha-D-glucan 1-alpha-D-glucosylmutase
MMNGLSQTLLKITSPGVADFYQGSELWDLRLVDPDNRGQIDFIRRAAALKEIMSAEAASVQGALRDLVAHWQDGRIKMHLIWKSLGFRRAHPDFFHEAEFVPLQTAGCNAANVIAFVRKAARGSVLVAIPRWLSQISRNNQQFDWCDTRLILPAGSPIEWNNILAGHPVAAHDRNGQACVLMNDVFRDFPVALLHA